MTAGAVLRFDLAVSNTGNQVAGTVSLTDSVPASSTFNPAASSPGWSCAAPVAASPCTLTLSNLSPGQTVHVTFAVTAASPLPPAATPERGDPTLTPLRPEVPVAEIPTLSELGLLTLAVVLAGTVLVFLRRRCPVEVNAVH